MRQSTSRHQTMMRDRLAMMAAIAMIGTACSGPNTITSTGISMIDEPKPTMPLSVPATSPTARMKRNSKLKHLERLRASRRRKQLVQFCELRVVQPALERAQVFLQALAAARFRDHDD